MRRTTYAAISTVAAREMRAANLLARALRSARHSGQSSPQPKPRPRRPHRTQGTSGSPLSDRMPELLRAGSTTEVTGANAILHDGGDDGAPDPLRPFQLSDVIQHHGR